MAIDDPLAITIQQVRDEVEAKSYLPARLARFGITAATTAALIHHPFVSG